MRHAVLLSGSIGMGHDALAIACAGELAERSWSTQTLDSMQLLRTGGRQIGETAFRSLLAMPGVFDAVHFSALRTGNRLALFMDAASRSGLLPKLRDQLDARRADLVISVFAPGASAVSQLAGRYPGMRHIVFCTDVTPHRLWVQPNVDLYLVTSVPAEAAVRRFEPDAQVLQVPAVVRPAFYFAPSQEDARAALDVPADARCVLLMSGAWGIGPLASVASALGDAGVHVLAVAGQNAKLAAKLRAVARERPRVRPFGFTDRVPELMAAADLVISSSGDTCAEARTVGRPLLLLDVLQGHGRDNLQHELELGDAGVTSARPGDVVRNAISALDRAKPPVAGPARSSIEWQSAFSIALETIGLS